MPRRSRVYPAMSCGTFKFLDLPTEVLLMVAECSNTLGDLNSLVCANKYLHSLLNHLVYNRGLQTSQELNFPYKTGNIIHLACVDRRLKFLKRILDNCSPRVLKTHINDAYVDNWVHGRTALHLLCDGNLPDCLWMEDWDAAVNLWDKAGCKMVNLMADAGANVNILDNRGCSPLHTACESGSPELITAFLKAGADPDVADIHGDRPIHKTAYSVQNGAVASLIGIAELDSVNSDNFTALLLAIRWGKEETVFTLLHGGADVTIGDSRGHSVLNHLYMVRHSTLGIERIRELLLRKGLDLNCTDNLHQTFLHNICKHNRVQGDRSETVGWALKNGADPTITDYLGKTPLDYCNETSRRKGIKKRLEAHLKKLERNPST